VNWARAYVGIVIVVVGVLLLLDNTGVLESGDVISKWWPAPIVLGGILSWFANRRHWVPPLILIAGGTAVLLRTTGVVDDLGVLLPIILILVGIFVVFGRGFGTRAVVDGDSINSFNMFSGSELASHSRSFRGGKVGALFGGAEIDLRDSVPAPGATLDVFVAFGGVELKVPEGWVVDIRGLPIFGGFENATTRGRAAPDAPRLEIDATVLFGALEVKH
jgi:hypothetical protein